MAKSPKRSASVAATVAAITLAMVAEAGDTGMQVPQETSNEWLQKGFVEVNPAVVSPEGIATRITPAGREYLANLAQGTQMNATPSDPQPDTASTAQTQVEQGSVSYELETGIEITKSKRGGRTEVYPFEKMEIGHSFFVAKDIKTLASTVTSAKERAGFVEDTTKPQVKRRNGQMGYPKIYNKIFEARAAEKNGVKGTRIFRTK